MYLCISECYAHNIAWPLAQLDNQLTVERAFSLFSVLFNARISLRAALLPALSLWRRNVSTLIIFNSFSFVIYVCM